MLIPRRTVAIACCLVSGCAFGPKPKPLDPVAFYGTSGEAPAATQPSPAQVIPAKMIASEPPPTTAPISVVRRPSSRPTTAISLGQYMTLGGVVAEVNGTPIFAHRVLASISSALSANAKIMDLQQYKVEASHLISKEISEQISEELEYATAQRNLDEKDKQLAERATSAWRQRQIADAGGSLELARHNAPDIAHKNNPPLPDDLSFDELVSHQYRFTLTQLFYERKVFPRIEITANEMFDFYQRNVNKLFTKHGTIRFRLIKIDPRVDFKGAEAAVNKITMLRNRIVTGHEDFAKLAAAENDDKQLRASGGDYGWIQSGSMELDKVEKAVWEKQPGEVTDIVQDHGAYYIAKVEERTPGEVKAYDTAEVQDVIRRTMRGQQFQEFRDKRRESLRKSAVIRVDDQMMATALEMAMQMYPIWSNP